MRVTVHLCRRSSSPTPTRSWLLTGSTRRALNELDFQSVNVLEYTLKVLLSFSRARRYHHLFATCHVLRLVWLCCSRVRRRSRLDPIGRLESRQSMASIEPATSHESLLNCKQRRSGRQHLLTIRLLLTTTSPSSSHSSSSSPLFESSHHVGRSIRAKDLRQCPVRFRPPLDPSSNLARSYD